MTGAAKNFNWSLSHSMSESQTRFAVTSDNVRQLNLSFNKSKIQQTKNVAKLKKQNNSITPAVQVV